VIILKGLVWVSDEIGYYLSGLTLIRVKGKKLVTKVYMG
jgi:hypothetical protein